MNSLSRVIVVNDFENVICVLFNKLFDLRYFPADWSEGFIVPLH